MPGGDGNGPMGMGPMTGRAAGYCAEYVVPGYMNPISGRGWGFGFGRGRGRGFGRGWGRGGGFGWGSGWGRGYGGAGYYGMPYTGDYYGVPYGNPYVPEMTPQQEADMLREQANVMQEDIKAINDHISELEKAAQSKKK